MTMSPADSINKENGSQSDFSTSASSEVAERTLDVLLCFLDADGELGVSEISQRLNIHRGRIHRFLTAARKKGFVSQNPRTRKYSLGFRVLELSHALSRQFDIVSQVQPFLVELRTATQETAGIAVRVADHRIHLTQAESEHEIRQTFPIGKPLPLRAGAAGKLLMAFQPEEEIDRLLSVPLERLTETTIVDPDRLRQELDRVRRQGYATSLGERMPGSISIAVPVWSSRGDVMALTVSGPAFRFTAKKAAEAANLLQTVALRLTRQLGGEPFTHN